jgi:hypothetical protein
MAGKLDKRVFIIEALSSAPESLLRFALLFCAILCITRAGTAGVSGPPESEDQIVGRYLSATREQQTALRGGSMEVDFDASVPKLKRNGKLHALKSISNVGKVTYHMLGFNGDNSVKKEVIARYMTAEVQSETGPDISITPQNYKFRFKGIRVYDGHPVYVLALSPRKKEVGLFKGELWLDQATCMPVREAGRFVKSPSVFLSKMEFTRSYDLQNGVSIPQNMHSRTNTRLFGPVELSIAFTHFSKDAESGAASIASTLGDQ